MRTKQLFGTLIVTAALTIVTAACGSDGSEATATDPAGPTDELVETPVDKLDINTATEAELMTIPGVGDDIAHEIAEYRPYDSMEKYRQELAKYIDEDEIARIEQYLSLGS